MRKPVLRAALVTALILAIPAAMTNISDEWRWGLFDFVFMGALIFGAGLTYEFVAHHGINKAGGTRAYRIATAIAVLTSLALIWMNAAVGIIGDGPHNALYAGVILVGIVGAALARLRPRGMAVTMFAMAAAQMLVPVIVLSMWDVSFSPGVAPVFALNAVFAGAFGTAGVMFHRTPPTSWADPSR